MIAKPLTQAELHHQLLPEIIQSIVWRPITTGGCLTDCEVLMEAVLAGVVETIERIQGPQAAPSDVLDRITRNTTVALTMRRRIAHEAAQKAEQAR